jgi:Na+/phosphate symporter
MERYIYLSMWLVGLIMTILGRVSQYITGVDVSITDGCVLSVMSAMVLILTKDDYIK